MRILMTFAAAGAALIPTVATAATPTTAPKHGAPTVQPDPASPGGRIWVSTAGCPAATGTATSPALSAPITLSPASLSGPGTLRDDLISGTYTLTLHCGGTLTTTIRVQADPDNADAAAPRGVADVGDGTASDHLGIGDAALGSAFVLGGIGFAVTSLIRRRRAGARE